MRIPKRATSLALATMLCAGLFCAPASALEYEFNSDAPGQTFHNSTSTEINHIADADQIQVGMDGTVANDGTGLVSSSPLSFLDLPVGEFPDAWGASTDLAIAQNTMIPNELGPTSTTVSVYTPIYTPIVMNGGLPTGANYVPAGMTGGRQTTAAGYTQQAGAAGYAAGTAAAMGVVTSGNGAVAGVSTQNIPMPEMNANGAIGKLSIPSIGLNKYVYEGTSQSNMAKGLAHFESTSGWLGNVAIAGHNRGNGVAYFAKLKDVKIGDTVSYTTAYGTANYVVTEINTRDTDDVSGLRQDGTNKITMYTCKANQPEVKLEVVATMVGTNG